MTDSINNDVKIITRYAMGLTPEEQRISMMDPSTITMTIGLEKGIRGGISIFPDLTNPKKALQEQKAIEQGLKGANFKETYKNFGRNMEIQELEKRFRAVSSNAVKNYDKIQQADNIKKLAQEANKLSGTAKTAKLREVQQAISNYQSSQGITDIKQVKSELKELMKKDLAKELRKAQKALKEFNKSQMYNGVRQLINDAKGLKGKAYADKMKEIQKAIADADLRVLNETANGALKPITKRGQIWNGVKKYTGYTAGKKAVNTALTKSEGLRKVAKFGRSNALTAVGIDLALAVPEIYATKQTFDQVDENGNALKPGEGKGTEKALKQTARVVGTAGAQVAAYAIGAKAGTAAVAALWAAKGAALGSVAPGFGTLIGGIVGLGVGLAASYFTGKAMEKAFGKSELDQLQDKCENKPAEDLAAKAQANDEILSEVLAAAQQRYENDPEQSELIENAYKNTVQAYKEGKIGNDSTYAQASAKEEKPKQTQVTQNTPQASGKKQLPKVDAKDKKTATTSETKKNYTELIKQLDVLISYFESYNFGGTTFNNMNISNMSYMNFTNPYMNMGVNQWNLTA